MSALSYLGGQFEFTGSATCTYAGCWPHGYQELLVAAPALVAALAMALLGTFGRRASHPVRALVPAGIFVVLTVVQVAVWDRVLGFLSGPPPW